MAEILQSGFRPIQAIEALGDAAVAGAANAESTGAAGSFAGVLAEAVGRVEGYRTQADQAVQQFLNGQNEELHKVAMATQQAELSFELFLQVKNKVVQAYQEVMRMQL